MVQILGAYGIPAPNIGPHSVSQYIAELHTIEDNRRDLEVSGKANKYFALSVGGSNHPSEIRFLRFACINGRYLAFADHMILSSHPEGSVGGREVPVIYVVVNAMI